MGLEKSQRELSQGLHPRGQVSRTVANGIFQRLLQQDLPSQMLFKRVFNTLPTERWGLYIFPLNLGWPGTKSEVVTWDIQASSSRASPWLCWGICL